MSELRINGIPVRVAPGTTVLEAAQSLAIDIPTLCHLKDCEPETSCMLCVVQNVATGQLMPACSAKATEGLDIDTECEEVQAARRDILNLLLSEHVGDCEAPCTRICPAHLDIPLMLREIERGNIESAAWIARRDLAIPSILSYVCPAPCEKGCRRGQLDSPIPIRELHRPEGSPEGSVREFRNSRILGLTPLVTPLSSRVAVVGSGPAGLGCAWQLRLMGFGCTVFDEASLAGGALREHESLPMEVLDAELELLRQVGIEFRLGQSPLADDFDGVITADEHKLAVKAVANGKAAAMAWARERSGATAAATERFDSKVGKLRESEVQELEKNCSTDPAADVQAEAARCLHCDCRKPVSCKLRKYAEQYGADQREFPADERGHIQLIGHDEAVVFEPGKCIKCGLCVKIIKRAGEEPGLAFTGRGFNMQVAVPFGENLQAGLKTAAAECVDACPTGALAFRSVEEK